MCATKNGFPWERAATANDLAILSKRCPTIDFYGMHEAMSALAFRPLTTDLVLLAGVLLVEPDDMGVGLIPFSGIDPAKKEVVKLRVMDGIVGWMENSALGTRMWRQASEWAMERHGVSVEFMMKCNCVTFSARQLHDGTSERWIERFNRSREDETYLCPPEVHVRGVPDGTDITVDQFLMWKKMRGALIALDSVQERRVALAA